jgi:hypothetical protein
VDFRCRDQKIEDCDFLHVEKTKIMHGVVEILLIDRIRPNFKLHF